MAKKLIPITLYLNEIIYDIQNKTYVIGRNKDSGDNPEQVAAIQASDEPESYNQLLRSIGNALSMLRQNLGDYLDVSQTTSNDNQFEADSDIVIQLNLPMNFNEASIDAVTTAMHQYIVNTAIAGWFSLVNPDESEKYIQLASNNYQMLSTAMMSRKRPVKP